MRLHLNPLPKGEEIDPFSLREKVRMRQAIFRAKDSNFCSPLCLTTGGRLRE
jgi:hypothetical protein